MPYIEKERRTDIVVGDIPENPGELNFAICALVDNYIREHAPGLNYTALNTVYGAMQAAAAEFYRRVLGPYEDLKKLENGEVFLCLGEIR